MKVRCYSEIQIPGSEAWMVQRSMKRLQQHVQYVQRDVVISVASFSFPVDSPVELTVQ